MRDFFEKSDFIVTYREDTHFNTIMYRPENEQINFDFMAMKKDFYIKSSIDRWDKQW
jgi:hypothetical protein